MDLVRTKRKCNPFYVSCRPPPGDFLELRRIAVTIRLIVKALNICEIFNAARALTEGRPESL